jgi:hypothetical protein
MREFTRSDEFLDDLPFVAGGGDTGGFASEADIAYSLL